MKKEYQNRKNRSAQNFRRHAKITGTAVCILFLAMTLRFFFYKDTAGGSDLTDAQAAKAPQAEAAENTGNSSDTGSSTISDNSADTGEQLPWYLILINSQNPIPKDYTVNLVELEGGERVDERIYEALTEMLEDAKEANAGQLPVVVSGYRTTDDQQRIFDGKFKKYRRQGYSKSEALELAGQYAALPDCSEHQSGLAVDINGAVYDVYLWLQENSYKYGFIFRYPGSKTELTGIAEEVWHYRYVGREAAAEIFQQGVCLEEYVENGRR